MAILTLKKEMAILVCQKPHVQQFFFEGKYSKGDPCCAALFHITKIKQLYKTLRGLKKREEKEHYDRGLYDRESSQL
jgi:hypothetical protein